MRLEAPPIIQGGMGVGVSSPRLAKTVSICGELGVVSGTAVAITLARKLQNGDQDCKRAVENFPDSQIAENILKLYYLPKGRQAGQRFAQVPMAPPRGYGNAGTQLTVVGNFAEVFLAKEGHDGLVGVNYLEKLQRPHLPSLYGAMLAGVDVVVMGAGIPTQVPGALDLLANQQKASYRLYVVGALPEDEFDYSFDPQTFSPICAQIPLQRPDFFAIISSHILAKVMTSPKKVSGKVNGLIVEGPTAGGHNAPPRDKTVIGGEAIYNDHDQVDFAQVRQICLENDIPFYIAGGVASPAGLARARELGARGIQVGTAFALSNESGLLRSYKNFIRAKAYRQELVVRTDAEASPSGYPFKVAEVAGTISQAEVSEARPELCDLGFLQTLYRTNKGKIAARCPAEEVDIYLKKGGNIDDTKNRVCLCNALTAALDLAQTQPGERNYTEKPIFTLGDDHSFLKHLMTNENDSYSAEQVIAYLRGST